jgi:hypothetical protein
MLNNFQALVNNILENMNAAGAGGSLGTPQEPVYNPPSNVNNSDSMARGDARYVYGGFSKKGKNKSKKKNKSLIIRRNLQRKAL